MTDYLVKVDMADLASVSGMIDKTVFPRLSQTVAFLVEQGYESWVQSVRQANGVWKGDKARYEDSLKRSMTGDFSGEIWTHLKLAEEIDEGRPERDLKRMLDSSTKVRVSGEGNRYLIIPFRHNIPGQTAWNKAMPTQIYAQAKKLAQSRLTGKGMRPTGEGYAGGTFLSDPKTKSKYLVASSSYDWNGRLPAGLAEKMKPHHTTDIYAGMVKMAANSKKGKSSTYLTFRIMSEAPNQKDKWIIGQKPGLFLAKDIEQKIQGIAEKSFSSAVAADLMGI